MSDRVCAGRQRPDPPPPPHPIPPSHARTGLAHPTTRRCPSLPAGTATRNLFRKRNLFSKEPEATSELCGGGGVGELADFAFGWPTRASRLQAGFGRECGAAAGRLNVLVTSEGGGGVSVWVSADDGVLGPRRPCHLPAMARGASTRPAARKAVQCGLLWAGALARPCCFRPSSRVACYGRFVP